MRDVLAKMRECGKEVKMRDFTIAGWLTPMAMHLHHYNTVASLIVRVDSIINISHSTESAYQVHFFKNNSET